MKKIFKDKKMLVIILSSIVILVVIIALLLIFNRKEIFGLASNPDGKRFANDYEKLNNTLVEENKSKTYPKVNIPSDNIMHYSSVSEILSIFTKDESAVVYFGSPTCLYCRSAIEVLCNTAKGTRLDKIYYVDSFEKDDNYNKLVQELGEEIVKDGEIPIPLVIFISYGDIVSYWEGTLFSQNDPYQKLDDSQIKGLSEIYQYGINDVVNSMNG